MNRFSSPLLTLIVLLVMSAGASSASAQTLGSLTTMLSRLEGQHTSVAEIGRGKVTVLTFWLTSCTPSKRQLDAMRPLVEEFADSVQFIAVSIDNAKTIARVAPLVASKNVTMVVLLDPVQELYGQLNATEHPYTLIFGADGNIALKHMGYYSGDEETIRAAILQLTGRDISNGR